MALRAQSNAKGRVRTGSTGGLSGVPGTLFGQIFGAGSLRGGLTASLKGSISAGAVLAGSVSLKRALVGNVPGGATFSGNITGANSVDLFVFLGYSNMLGWTTLVSEAPSYLSTMGSGAQYASDGGGGISNYTLADSQIGPEAEFAYRYTQANPGRTCYIAKATVNGTTLAVDWQPGGSGWNNATTVVNRAYNNLVAAGKIPVVRAIFWALGGIDAQNSAQAAAYEANLTAFIATVRSNSSFHANSSTPFIMSRIEPVSRSPDFIYADTVRTADFNVAMAGTNVVLTDTDAYPLNGDNIHYTTAGQITHGADFWAAYTSAYATAATISGVTLSSTTPSVGVAITASPATTGGKFPGVPTSYQWRWADTNAVISGATSASYTPVSGDLGHTLKCTISVANQAGTASATSSATSAVANIAVPTNTVAPALSTTTPQVGTAVTVSTGTWTGSPTSYAYQWYWADTGAPISGATVSSYTPITGDIGHTLKCAVTANNAGGSSTAANSNTSSAVALVSTSAVWNPAAAGTAAVLSNSNRDFAATSGYATVRATQSKSAGKWYIEFQLPATTGAAPAAGFGLADASANLNSYLGSSPIGFMAFLANNFYFSGGGFTQSSYNGQNRAYTGLIGNAAANDVYMMAVDFDAGLVWMGKNGTWYDAPGAADYVIAFTPNTALFPAATIQGAGCTWRLPATNAYSTPAGYTAWNG